MVGGMECLRCFFHNRLHGANHLFCFTQDLQQQGLYCSLNLFISKGISRVQQLIELPVNYNLFQKVFDCDTSARELVAFQWYWNTHKICKNRLGDCLDGISNDLYDMPEHHCKLYY